MMIRLRNLHNSEVGFKFKIKYFKTRFEPHTADYFRKSKKPLLLKMFLTKGFEYAVLVTIYLSLIFYSNDTD